MRCYKIVENNIIIAIGIGLGGEEIEKAQYDEIYEKIKNIPQADGGYAYKLKENLEWELVEEKVETDIVEEEATEQDYIEALNELGVDTNEEEQIKRSS